MVIMAEGPEWYDLLSEHLPHLPPTLHSTSCSLFHQGTKVVLNVYDLSPANDALWTIGFGLHHSGIEIMGTEYSFASGGGIFESTPKEAPGAKFRVAIELGSFDGGQAQLRQALSDLRNDFGPDDYNLIKRNCNHFANALSWKLLNRQIPSYVNRLADIGFCCSCLLPKQMIEHAPVGDPTGNSSSSGGSIFSSSAPKRQTAPAVFTGSGAKLGGTSSSSTSGGGLLGSLRSRTSNTSGDGNADDANARRERARLAAMARMERGNTESDTDKSR